jgi:hypothetical protein
MNRERDVSIGDRNLVLLPRDNVQTEFRTTLNDISCAYIKYSEARVDIALRSGSAGLFPRPRLPAITLIFSTILAILSLLYARGYLSLLWRYSLYHVIPNSSKP